MFKAIEMDPIHFYIDLAEYQANSEVFFSFTELV